MHTIQMHLPRKQKIFSEFFASFFESALNFAHFQKKMTLIAYVFPKLKNHEKRAKTNVSKLPFQRTHREAT